jgi:hypothetical protein
MTIETKTTIEMRDIKTVEFECGTCHTKVVYDIEKFTVPMMICYTCHPSKTLVAERSSDDQDIRCLIHMIQKFSKLDPSTFRMRFSVENLSASREAGGPV